MTATATTSQRALPPLGRNRQKRDGSQSAGLCERQVQAANESARTQVTRASCVLRLRLRALRRRSSAGPTAHVLGGSQLGPD